MHIEDLILERQGDNITISWNSTINKEVRIYWTNIPKINDNIKLIGCTKDNFIKFKDPEPMVRNYYVLEVEGYHREILGERLIPLKGVVNFRDLGGYKTYDGRRVKWNKFYRSDALYTLTKEDIAYINDLGIKVVFDYRSIREVEEKPDPSIEGIEIFNISAMKALDKEDRGLSMFDLIKKEGSLRNIDRDMLRNSYKDMVINNEAFKETIRYISKKNSSPIAFHCTAGKDRTGLAAALILSILGVPEEIILEDYMSTNMYIKSNNEKLMEPLISMIKDKESIEIFNALMGVRKEYILESFNTIIDSYKTMEDYLYKEYDLDKKKLIDLRDYYLY
ncbi:tyrosine-protein phosphatase [Clostridium sp.]|uniref:tyrosine-protein phosphatase n=1 Tax=Clostridium sp. TaxID=1506 RepID=UPI003463C844